MASTSPPFTQPTETKELTTPILSSTTPLSPSDPTSGPATSSSSLSDTAADSFNTTATEVASETDIIPEVTSEDIFTSMIPTTTPEVTPDPANAVIREDIKQTKTKLRSGYFTACTYALLKITSKKSDEDLMTLLVVFHNEISKLNSYHHLAMFGPFVNSALTAMVRVMASSPIELIRIQQQNGIKMIEKKREEFQSDTNAVFDVVDAIYDENDFNNIADALTELQNYPNITKASNLVVDEIITAFILTPHARIQGTAREKLLYMELNKIVRNRLVVDETQVGRRHRRIYASAKVKSPINITKVTSSRNTINKMKKALKTPTTVNSSETDYTSYVKDPKIMARLRHKMRIYKEKFRKIRRKEHSMKSKRGLTTTKYTTSTTKTVPMHKSKYYIRKYVKKDLYKLKTTTVKSTWFTWRYYGKVKKFRKFIDDDDLSPNNTGTDTSSDGDEYYSDSNDYDYGVKSNGDKTSMPKSANKRSYKNGINTRRHVNSSKLRNYKKTLIESSDSYVEEKLKVNLRDAMYHPNNATARRRTIKSKIHRFRITDSFSDDEAILKGNIYKAFGYTNDFAQHLRTIE